LNAQHDGGIKPPKKNWWQRRSKLSKVALVIGALVVVGMIAGRSSDSKTAPADASAEASVSTSEPAPVEDATGPHVPGRFHRDCFGCGDLVRYIDTSDAWCAWDGDKVLVHVTMTNRSVEHVTVNWHPSYELVGGSSHGTGLTSLEDSGFDAGETRELVSEQNPDGVASGAEIGACKPSFFLVESG
jgi:hypothetical protein